MHPSRSAYRLSLNPLGTAGKLRRFANGWYSRVRRTSSASAAFMAFAKVTAWARRVRSSCVAVWSWRQLTTEENCSTVLPLAPSAQSRGPRDRHMCVSASSYPPCVLRPDCCGTPSGVSRHPWKLKLDHYPSPRSVSIQSLIGLLISEEDEPDKHRFVRVSTLALPKVR